LSEDEKWEWRKQFFSGLKKKLDEKKCKFSKTDPLSMMFKIEEE